MTEHNELPLWSDREAGKILYDLCEQHNVSQSVLKELVELQIAYLDMARAHGIYEKITEILDTLEPRTTTE